MSDKLVIELTPKNFEYDVFSLVQSFYPGREVEVAACGEEYKDVDNIIRIKFTDTLLSVDFKGQSLEESIDYGDRKSTKNVLKQAVYRILREETGTDLPWGTLTGIRPVRIPLTLMEEGKSEEYIDDYLTKTYYVSPAKKRLCLDIARRESDILKTFDYKKGYSLYIGIPFCPTICLYCSFTSFTADKWEASMDEYLTVLEKEIDFFANCFGKSPDSIYIGGGTPTVLSPARLDRLLSHVEKVFSMDEVREYTVEAGRPDTIDEDKLKVLRNHGISRISINPQTMNDKTLEVIGRKHTVDDIRRCFHMAKDLGFDNINMDVIVGLPGEGMDEVAHTIDEVIALHPSNITVHSLAIKRAARLNLFKEEYRQMGIVNNDEIMDMTARKICDAGLNPYYLYRQKNMAGNMENVGYALPGTEGLYNILIMEEKQTIAACGAGSSTKRVWPDGQRIERVVNPKDIKTYLTGIDSIIDKKIALLEE